MNTPEDNPSDNDNYRGANWTESDEEEDDQS